jgi:membrane glycosyltransferase
VRADPSFRVSRYRVFFRRFGLLLLVIVPSVIATAYMAYILPHGGGTAMEFFVLVMFAILYAWISVGFWTAMAGLAILVRGADKYSVSRIYPGETLLNHNPDVRTAVVMPVYNESAPQVLSCLCATIDSLLETNSEGQFDFFILSDPGDPDTWLQEEMAWADLRYRYQDAPCGIFYRRRNNNEKRKSGNIADFCRRWGRHYRYLFVLDADSVMRGQTMVQMVGIMECRSEIGILQSPPALVNRETLIARTQQFTSSLYGTMFAAGLNFWQFGDSQFWGHNAVIRMAPFMKHCDLPRLPGKPPLGGDILSHDFVEAAFMRRAGYEVWLGYDLGGSYEQPPTALLSELKRDHRWCQGNLQHLRLLFARGIRGVHRTLFLNGAMAYGSALFWFLFLAASSIMAILKNIREPDYFPEGRSLFPQWPVWEPQWALVLLASTGFILFLPKILSLIRVLLKGQQSRLFGGRVRLLGSFLLEILFSTLLAPTRMLFHAKFVFLTLLGRGISWEAQERGDVGTSWSDAFRFHLGVTFFALCWGKPMIEINRAFFWWLSPILISLLVAIPVSVWSSRREGGMFLKRYGLMLIPEEVQIPPELQALRTLRTDGPYLGRVQPDGADSSTFAAGVMDPRIYTLHMHMLASQQITPAVAAEHLADYCRKALEQGPDALDSNEISAILSDPASMRELHRRVWEISDPELSRKWRLPGA